MKTTTSLLALAAGILVFGSATSSNAQYRAVGDDGIAASPKIRQLLDEHKRSAKVVTVTSEIAPKQSIGHVATGDRAIAASPRLRQALDERKASTKISGANIASTKSAGYRAVDANGVVASPKLRQQLDEQKREIMVAPLK